MTKQNKQIEEQQPLNIGHRCYCKLADVEIASDTETPEHLAEIIDWLLKKKSIKDYLAAYQKNKTMLSSGSYN